MDIDIEDLFSNRLKNAQIMVVGDMMLDRHVFGSATRLSPESPVPVLNVEDESCRLGGAANAVANLVGLGVRPHIAGVIGRDNNGDILADLLGDMGCDMQGLIREPRRSTIVKTRFLADKQQLLRVDHEEISPLSVSNQEKILEYVHSKSNILDVIILSDYGKGMFLGGLAADIIRVANKIGVPVIVDPKGEDYSIYRGASVLTPNLKELSQVADLKDKRSNRDVVECAQRLAAQNDIETVLVTRSEDGMSLIPGAQNSFGLDHVYHLKSNVADVSDVSGAGDTVIATFAACMACDVILSEAANIANIAAGIVVRRVGTTAISRRELEGVLAPHLSDGHHPQRIFLQSQQVQARKIVERWRAQGLKIGFTNGCFDVLHAGHVAYLSETRQKCDRLIVGLNADSSVRRLKGDGRPVNCEADRAAVLAALQPVDMVVLFGEEAKDDDKAIPLIERLRPDIYFKGGDYVEAQIPEAPTVRGYGGDLYICRSVEGVSSTLTIEKIRASGNS